MLKERIDSIVERRQAAKGQFDSRIANAKKWKQNVDGLLNIFHNKRAIWNAVLNDSNSANEAAQLEKKLETLSAHISNLLGDSDTGEGTSLKAALERASRQYVNLGIIGPWRIGKSLIVQKLTNLDTWQIPTDKADNCTACPIHVINEEHDGDQDVAVISVYSVSQMCRILNDYIDHCKLDEIPHLDATTRDQFLSQCKTRYLAISNITNPGGDMEGFFDKMKDYFGNAESYYKILSHDGIIDKELVFENVDNANIVVTTGKIILKGVRDDNMKRIYRPFVSYYAVPNSSEYSYKCLATESATLYVDFRFLNENIGKLRIMDTPGIGECKLNVSEGLSHALRYDLDIAVATASAKPNLDDIKQVKSFHNILKKETAGRCPEQWLYYMFNVYSTYPQMDSTVLKKKHDSIKSDLAQNIVDGPGIMLNDSHYADVDALINKGIICPSEDGVLLDTCQDEAVNLSTYYDTILREMVDGIDQVDGIFYKKAKDYYRDVADEFESVMDEARNLSVIRYDNQIIRFIADQMSRLNNAIREVTLDLQLRDNMENGHQYLEPTLSMKINRYCDSQDYGKELTEILGINGRVNNKDFNSLFDGIKDTLRKKITRDSWLENQDFDIYIALKRDLIAQIEKKVLSQFDKEQANKRLRCEKKKILDVYFSIGRFSDILDTKDEDWLDTFIALLREEGQYPELMDIFEKFRNYELMIEDVLKQNIKTLRIRKQHRDLFVYDSDDLTPFDSYEKALKAFAYSLYNIEVAIKEELAGNGDNSYEMIIVNQEGDFDAAMSPIKTIPSPVGNGGYTRQGVQLQQLYMANGHIFKEDETAVAKNAVSMEWRNKVHNKQ